MPRVEKISPTPESLPIMRKTITETIEQEPAPPSPAKPEDKIPIEDFLSGVPRSEWLVNTAYYLYRLNESIAIAERFQGEHRGAFLRYLTADDFREFEEGNFWYGLQSWVKKKYGGSNYRIIINNTKDKCKTLYNKSWSIEGAPILDNREVWRNGAPSASGPAADQSQFTNQLLGFLKEQIEKQQNRDGSTTLETAMNTISQVQKNAMEIAKNQMPQPMSPADIMGMMMGIFKEMMTQNRPQASETDLLIKAIALLKDSGMIQPKQDAGGFAMIKEIVAGLKEMGIKVGGGGGAAAQDDWRLEVVKALPEIGRQVHGIVDRVVTARTMPIIAARAPAISAQSSLGIGPSAIIPRPMAATTTAPNPPVPGAQSGPAATMRSIEPEEAQAILWTWLRQRIVDWIQHDVDGGDAALAIQMNEPGLAAMIRQQTPEDLTKFLQADPIMCVIKDDPRLPGFVEAMLAFFKEDADETNEHDDTNVKVN